jgi:DNA polymerase-3 subunit alpha/error-prone DNA polymerase
MRGLLRRLKCNNYKILVAASSIIRPGVAQMMKEYILDTTTRSVEYFHETFKEHLRNLWCYGVSGRCNKIALHFASTRLWWMFCRAMSGKDALWLRYKSKRQFFCMCSKGHPLALSQEIYRQIESFAGTPLQGALGLLCRWKLSKSILKVHYPVEFMVAVINNQGGFYRTEVYVHEAKCPVVLSTPLCQQKWMWNYCIWSWRLPRFYATRRARF